MWVLFPCFISCCNVVLAYTQGGTKYTPATVVAHIAVRCNENLRRLIRNSGVSNCCLITSLRPQGWSVISFYCRLLFDWRGGFQTVKHRGAVPKLFRNRNCFNFNIRMLASDWSTSIRLMRAYFVLFELPAAQFEIKEKATLFGFCPRSFGLTVSGQVPLHL